MAIDESRFTATELETLAALSLAGDDVTLGGLGDLLGVDVSMRPTRGVMVSLAYEGRSAPQAEPLYAEISEHLGLKPGSAGLIDEMDRIAEAVGIERSLSQLGISHNDVPKMAEDVAANDRLLPNNPREMTYEAIVAMYEEIL